MRKFTCDRCQKEVSSGYDIEKLCLDTLEDRCDSTFADKKHRHVDLCKSGCYGEYVDLKMKILKDNKQRIMEWFTRVEKEV